METTKEITTPVRGHKVVIKTMLTGGERESVQSAAMKYVKTSDGSNFDVTDMEKMALAEKHALLSVSVVSIDDDPTDVLTRLLKMMETDYEFVYHQIGVEQKKMKESISPASS